MACAAQLVLCAVRVKCHTELKSEDDIECCCSVNCYRVHVTPATERIGNVMSVIVMVINTRWWRLEDESVAVLANEALLLEAEWGVACQNTTVIGLGCPCTEGDTSRIPDPRIMLHICSSGCLTYKHYHHHCHWHPYHLMGIILMTWLYLFPLSPWKLCGPSITQACGLPSTCNNTICVADIIFKFTAWHVIYFKGD